MRSPHLPATLTVAWKGCGPSGSHYELFYVVNLLDQFVGALASLYVPLQFPQAVLDVESRLLFEIRPLELIGLRLLYFALNGNLSGCSMISVVRFTSRSGQ